MLKAYVGIAGPRGLESLLPEAEDASTSPAPRDPSGRSATSIRLWAVLPDDDAREVCRQIRSGDTLAALDTLDRSAACLGPILPRDVH
jgi:hypothetical protein